jgi:peptide/nickel transport system substrate-binding protein
MVSRRSVVIAIVLAVVLVAPLLMGCGATATPTAVPTKAPTTAATAAPATAPAATAAPTKPAATATPAAAAPTVGGTLVWSTTQEVDTLDPHKGTMAVQQLICSFLGSSLVMKDPDGKYVPYLADSWKVSADGLVWDFAMKKNVKFHDGSAMTAKDFAYTISRAIDPATKSPSVGGLLAPVKSAEAVDDYTLRLNLKEPYYPLMETLSDPGWLQPLSKKAIETLGEKYARQPIGVGPYKFKEWVTGQKIVVERNPDFNWGPAFQHQGAYYIQTIEFRIIPEVSTLLAGLESGELGWADPFSLVQAKDVPRIQATGKYNIYEGYQQGLRPYLLFNVEHWPFDDVRVRQAFNYALDRVSMMKAISLGQAIEQKGPLSPSQIGYWPDIEKMGYTYDVAKAKSLLKDAGFTAGSDGILAKDGKPFKFTILCLSSDFWVNVAQVVQEQFKALGVSMQIERGEAATALATMREGKYDVGVMGMTASEADILYRMFHSSQIPGLNMSQIRDKDLDKLLEGTRTSTDATKRQDVVNQVQKYIVEKAYVGFMFVPKNFYVLTNKVKGAIFSSKTNSIYLGDAYFTK